MCDFTGLGRKRRVCLESVTGQKELAGDPSIRLSGELM